MTQQPGFNPHTGASGGYGQPYGQPQQQYGEVVPYQQPSYSVQPLMQPMYANPPAAAKTNTMALMSLIFSLVGLVIFPGLLQILALIFGIVGKNQIKTSGEGGAGMATAGIVISAIVLGLGLIVLILYIIFAVVLAGAGIAAS